MIYICVTEHIWYDMVDQGLRWGLLEQPTLHKLSYLAVQVSLSRQAA